MTGAGIVVRQRVEWRDTDAAGHYHHSAVLHWAEVAEARLQESLGLGDLFGSVPRVRYEADYLARLWFRDIVDVDLRVADVGRTSVTYTFEIRRDDETVARGRMVTAHTDPATGSPTPWTDDERRLFLNGHP